MTEVFSRIVGAPIWLVFIVVLSLYLIIVGALRVFLRPAMVGNLDPLNIIIFTSLCPAIVGLALTPYLVNSATQSYFLILMFMGFWILVIRVAGKPRKIDLSDRMGVDFQATLLFLTVLIIIANVTVNMIIPGKIPLLTEGGGLNSRFEATQNSRLLSWLSLGTTPMAGLLYAVTENSRIRKFAIIAMFFQIGANLLFASKGAIVAIVFVLLNALFIARVRNDQERYRKIRRGLIGSVMAVALLAPFYFYLIGVGSGSDAVVALVVRVLGGFDQLIFASQFDLLRHAGSDSLMKVNLFEYQLMPFFKGLLSTQFDYSSIGQYVLASVTGRYIDGPSTFPNSNLILETILTSGKYLGMVFFLMELSCFYWCRRFALRRSITPFSLVIVQSVVLAPTGLFYSGQEWVTETILVFFTVVAALALSKSWEFILFVLRMRAAPAMVE
jgi:hypothetical protein